MDARNASSLPYQDLSPRSFRVLYLLSGSGDDPIRTRLETASLDDPGRYKALSYVWGSTTHGAQDIECNGEQLKVTASLFVALRRFRHPTDTVRMWADALCINQSSLSERSHQVKRMTEIYGKAEEVMVWVADECQNGSPELLFRVSESRSSYQSLYRLLREVDGKTPVVLASDDIEPMARIIATQHRYQPITPPESVKSTLSNFENKSSKAMYIGSKRIDGYYPSNGKFIGPVLVLYIRVEPERVEKAVKDEHPTLELFLEEALKPKEWFLTTEEIGNILNTLIDLGNNPYFHRAWIIQEILMANVVTLYWGKYYTDFDQFCQNFAERNQFQGGMKLFVSEDLLPDAYGENSRDWIADNVRKTPHAPGRWAILLSICSDRLNFRYKVNGRATLSKLLDFYSGQESADPRDVLFSLLGLVQEHSEDFEEREWCMDMMDYTSDYRTLLLQVATRLAMAYSRDSSRKAHILEFFQPGHTRKDISLPSWVPEWQISQTIKIPIGPLLNVEHTGVPFPSPRVRGESLFLKVKILGAVQFASGLLRALDPEGMIGEMDIYERCTKLRNGNPYKTEHERSKAFWMTAITDSVWYKLDTARNSASSERVSDWVLTCLSRYKDTQSLWGGYIHLRPCVGYVLEVFNELSEETPFEERLQWCAISAGMWIMVEFGLDAIPPTDALKRILAGEMSNRLNWESMPTTSSLDEQHFIQTMSGYFGLATPGVMSRDLIVYVPGCMGLWCLRPWGRYFTVASNCYLYGISNRVDGLYRGLERDLVEVELR